MTALSLSLSLVHCAVHTQYVVHQQVFAKPTKALLTLWFDRVLSRTFRLDEPIKLIVRET